MLLLVVGVVLSMLGDDQAAAGPRSFRGSAAIGYRSLHDGGVTYGSGLSLSVGYRIWGGLSLEAEAARSSRTADYRGTGGGMFQSRYESIRGGLRFARAVERVRPYGQLLVGPMRSRFRERLDPLGRATLTWGSRTQFSLAPGLGLDIVIKDRVSLNGGWDLNMLSRRDGRSGESYTQTLSSFHAGLALHWGGR